MDITQSTVIWVGQEQGIKRSPQNRNTTSGTPKTCYDCHYSEVCDMNFEDILLCKQHNTYVHIEAPICSKYLKERWVQ